jgi:Domain of unknown function (DUF4271)
LAKKTALFLFFLIQITLIRAQSTGDSIRAAGDSGIIKPVSKDSLSNRQALRKPVRTTTDSIKVYYTDSIRFSAVKPVDFSHLPQSWTEVLQAQAFFNFTGKAIHVRSKRYEPVSYDGMFYLLVILLFYFAIIRPFFAKYLANLFTIFFRASMRQQQLREQVLQSPFPSLLLNSLFILSGGLYGAFLGRFYHFGSPEHFWLHFLYVAIILTVLYLFKYLILRIAGWIFNIRRAVDTYLFVVFMTNKIIGIFLLPFVVLISFAGQSVTEISITLSIIMVCIFYIYRFVASYSTLYKEIKISGLHFFLYLCALEIAPLLLIYKVLVTYLEKAY